MTKKEALAHWRNMPANLDPMQHMEAIPYKTTGSRYGACGVRIDGNPAFVDAVLSCLKTMLDGEGIDTRLELARREVQSDFKATPNAGRGAEVCYIRLHERGREGKIAACVFGVV